MPLGNTNFRVNVREIQLIIVLYSSLPMDLKPSYSPVKPDKLKYLRIFFRKQTCINSRVDKMISHITPSSIFYDAKIT